MVGSYAHTRRKNVANGFRFGEGLVGQAGLEKKSILVTSVPEDYVAIGSGLGEASARNIIVVPFKYEGIVTGVIEIGSFEEFSDTQLEFLEQASENIAIAINSAQSRSRMSRLLEETQRQSEELQSQQEQLRMTNEQLEQQADRLRRSEETLKAQQEKLESANADLETKTVELEEQKYALEESWNEVKAKSQELEHANKYKSQFLANMSHELRTPLNSMLILAKMLCDNEERNLTSEQVDSAKVIYDGGNELLSLINEILDLSKIEAGKVEIQREEVDISALSDDIEKSFKYMAQEKGLEFKINISQELPASIRTDGKRVKQVIGNFLSNAFKFTEKGEVAVDIARPVEGVDLGKSGLRHSSSVAISVCDTGIGVAKDKQELIMEAFRQADGTTSRTYGGTGLGLSISRELAKLLGGEVQLQSEPGKGSRFTLYLPEKMKESVKPVCVRQTDQFVEPNKAGANPGVANDVRGAQVPIGKQIVADDRNNIGDRDKVMLIIEDDARFAKILVEMSRERDFKCLVAGDGKTGLKFAVEYNPLAIILDVGLPGMDGMTVLDALKDDPKTRHIAVHFISARDEIQSSTAALSKGAIGYLTKPVSKEQLDQAFANIQEFITAGIKKLLVAEADTGTRESMVKLIASDDVEIAAVGSGREAYELLASERFDCMVLDMSLGDMSGMEFLRQMKNDNRISTKPPVIVYSDKTLSREEEMKLREYGGSVIVKGAESPARLLDETSLFLHRVESNLPAEQQKMIRMVHDKDSVLAGKKILVVDDDIRNIFALSHALKSRGMSVLRAENGQKALEVLDGNPDMDIVLMDIMMPVMDGFEAMRRIRQQERFWKLPVLALTAKAMKGDKEKCIDAGANDYLAKPIDIAKVLSMLRVWLYL